MELRSRAVIAVAGNCLDQRPIERDDRRVREEDIAELIQTAVETVVGGREVFEGMIEDFSKKCGECNCKPTVEGGIREVELATDALEVALAECFERADLVHGESKGERPEQGSRVEFPSALDEPGFVS